MDSDRLAAIAEHILHTNVYMTLATTDGERPWAAPVYYARGKEGVLFFISQTTSTHIGHIRSNPNVAFSIFDSHQSPGACNGIQGSGMVEELPDEVSEAMLAYYRPGGIVMKKDDIRGTAPYRMYKLVIEHMYVLDPEASDKRVEVTIP